MQLILLLLTFTLQSHAVDLSKLDASKFKRTEGTFEQCGDPILKQRDAGAYFDLSVWHIFSTENYTKKVDADILPLQGCVYDMKNARTVTEAVVVLNFNEVLNCGSEIRHDLNKLLTISADKLTMEVRQRGSKGSPEMEEPTFNYTCTWELKSASAKKKK